MNWKKTIVIITAIGSACLLLGGGVFVDPQIRSMRPKGFFGLFKKKGEKDGDNSRHDSQIGQSAKTRF
jgi:hypothetical protein